MKNNQPKAPHKILCVYHSADLDGICSGAIMRKKFPEAELFGYDYGNPFPWEKVDSNTHVYMADVSLPHGDMKRLNETSKGFAWIDHHKSAIDECRDLDLCGTQILGYAACELCWEYFFPNDEMPLAVQLLGRYDVWDHTDPRTLPFQYGARHYIQGVEDERWNGLLNDGYWENGTTLEAEVILAHGELLYEYQQGENKKYARARAFEAEFHGLKVIACNKSLANSQLFDSVYDPNVHDAMMVFGMRKDGSWKCSLYTTHEHIDVSVLCKELGGGGHKTAAGFISKEVPILPASHATP